MKYIRKVQNRKELADVKRNQHYSYSKSPAPSSFVAVRQNMFESFPSEMVVDSMSPLYICVTYTSGWQYFYRTESGGVYTYEQISLTEAQINQIQWVDAESSLRTVFDEVPNKANAASPHYILVGSDYYALSNDSVLIYAKNYPNTGDEKVEISRGPLMQSVGEFSTEFCNYNTTSDIVAVTDDTSLYYNTEYTPIAGKVDSSKEGFSISSYSTGFEFVLGTKQTITYDDSNTYDDIPYPAVVEDASYIRVVNADAQDGYDYYTKTATI